MIGIRLLFVKYDYGNASVLLLKYQKYIKLKISIHTKLYNFVPDRLISQILLTPVSYIKYFQDLYTVRPFPQKVIFRCSTTLRIKYVRVIKWVSIMSSWGDATRAIHSNDPSCFRHAGNTSLCHDFLTQLCLEKKIILAKDYLCM